MSEFRSGYWHLTAFKGRKHSRIVPIRENVPLLCISKHIYTFAHYRPDGKKRWVYKPRIYTGRQYMNTISHYLEYVLNCSDKVLQLHVPYKYMWGRQQWVFAFNHAFGFYPGLLMEKLGITEHNILISYAPKGKVKEFCNILGWLLDEGIDCKDGLLHKLHRCITNDLMKEQTF